VVRFESYTLEVVVVVA
jgi:hypothetical protein